MLPVSPNASHPLDDPAIDRVWIDAAGVLGFAVVRQSTAYASTDGTGTIIVGTRETLDADDTVAQLVLHELCHALVQGRERWRTPDWGLDNTTERDTARELACLRLQAALADEHGLRALMVPTTEWKSYYAALPTDPFAPIGEPGEQEIIRLARAAWALGREPDVRAAIERALDETSAFVARTNHPSGFLPGPVEETCGTCAWLYVGGRGPAVARCRQTAGEVGDGKRVSAALRACERWEPPVDCLTCGACCREAYHSVAVSMRDPVVWKQPAFVVRDGHRFSLLRTGERCACLEVKNDPTSPTSVRYGCSIYDDRPQTCRDFARGGRHCLTARRRVGLSR